MSTTPQAALDVPTEVGEKRSCHAAPSEPLSAGDVVGRYEVVSVLGNGGMGVVYEALDPDLKRRVALKLILPDAVGEQNASRLREEAIAMAQVSHPNVVTVVDVGEHRGEIYVAMEIIDGVTLREWLHEQPRPNDAIVTAFRDAGAGLVALHEAGLVHRDFKPDNVMIAGDRVVVMDLGLATSGGLSTSPSSPSTERSGFAAGTPAYMSPEQFAQELVDARADQFSFAVALYEALAGHRPFGALRVEELVFALETRDAPPLPRSVKVPPRMRRALARALSRDPQRRFESLDALLHELRPGRVWPRYLVAGGFGGCALAGVLAWGAAEPVCADPESVLGGGWDPATRQRVAAAFDGFEAGYQRERRDFVVAQLDRYVARWSDAYAKACASAAASEAAAGGIGCLEERAAELRGVSVGLMEARGDGIDTAIASVQGLRSLQTCSGAHTQGETPGERRLRLRTAEAVASLRAGATEPATLLLEELGTEPVEGAEALAKLRLRAELADATGHDEDASEAFAELYFAHSGAGRSREAYEMAMALVRVYSDGLRNAERARHWRRELESLRGESGTDPIERARYSVSIAAALTVEGELDRASAVLGTAMDEAEKRLADDVRVKARLANHVGWVFNKRERWGEALVAYSRAAELYARSAGTRHPSRASALANVGYVMSRLGEVEASGAAFDESITILTAAFGEDQPEVGLILRQRSWAEMRAGRWKRAKASLTAAMAIPNVERGAGPSMREQLAEIDAALEANSSAQQEERQQPDQRAHRDHDERGGQGDRP